MQDDINALIQRNKEINIAENNGDLEQLRGMVAEKLAFQKRDASIVDKEAFLSIPKPGNRVIQVESVHVQGNRAVVECVVTDAGASTHNIRLFVKVGGQWLLLGWANEPA